MNTISYAFTGGRIMTMDPNYPNPDVAVIAEDRIAAVGARALLQQHPDANVVDLRGRTLLPGFIDAHNHLAIASLHPLWVDISQCRDIGELAAALRAQAARVPSARWIRAANWDVTISGLMPDRDQLDALGLDRPIILAHFSLHQCVVDSRGLDELG